MSCRHSSRHRAFGGDLRCYGCGREEIKIILFFIYKFFILYLKFDIKIKMCVLRKIIKLPKKIVKK